MDQAGGVTSMGSDFGVSDMAYSLSRRTTWSGSIFSICRIRRKMDIDKRPSGP